MTTILVTRPAGEHDALVAALTERGYSVVAVPTAATETLTVHPERLRGFDWIVVTSAAGVAALPELPARSRYAAVGPATAAALEARGVSPEVVPEQSDGTALAEAIPEPAGKRVLLARADIAATDLPDRLRELGAEVVELAVYRTVEGPRNSRQALAAAQWESGLAAAVFASGSAVRGYLTLGGDPHLPAVTIGPRTTEVARAAGMNVIGEASEQSTRSLAAAVAAAVPLEVVKDA
jgi:uroporphyrinogen-III synthase